MSNSEDLDFEAVASYYGADQLPEGSGWRKMRCFNTSAHDDIHPSCSYHPEKRIVRCFACDLKGDAIEVIKIFEGVDYAGAVAIYERISGDSDFRIRRSTSRKRGGGVFNSRKRSYEQGSGFLPNRFRR